MGPLTTAADLDRERDAWLAQQDEADRSSRFPTPIWEPGTTEEARSEACSPNPVSEPGTVGPDPYADIAAMLDGTLPDPPRPAVLYRRDGHALFYAGQVNWVFGDPEGGKTWVCMAAAVEALKKNRRVLVVDLDHNGPDSTVSRLLKLGAPAEALRDRGRFRYTEPEDHVVLLQVVADMANWKPAVAVVDSVGELLPLFKTSSNSADEFTLVHSRVIKPLARSGAAVLAVDHLAKGQESRERGPGGTIAKIRAVGGVSLRVKVKDAFTPGVGGSAVLTVNKDRHGGVREHCPTGDREPLAGVFRLSAYADDVLEWEIRPPNAGERVAPETSAPDDVAAVAALNPPPTTVDDARERLGWRKDRAGKAMRAWREQANPTDQGVLT